MKRKIIACVNTGRKTKDGKSIFEVELDAGEKCTSFGEDFSGFIGQDVDVNIKSTGRFYNGVEPKWINLVRGKNETGNETGKKGTRYVRQIALTLAVETIKSIPITETKSIIELAEIYYEWLNK